MEVSEEFPTESGIVILRSGIHNFKAKGNKIAFYCNHCGYWHVYNMTLIPEETNL